MGRVRQQRKNRSSTSKAVRKPRSKKLLHHNPIIAAAWNKKETLTQNYRRLGLASKLNDPAGGTEPTNNDAPDSDEESHDEKPINADGLGIARSERPTQINVTSATVVRDPKTGAILQVIDASAPKANPLNDPLNELESDSDDGHQVWSGFVNEHGSLKKHDDATRKTASTKFKNTDVVQQLIDEATAPREKRIRKQSEREQEWISALVDKYADDYAKMSRDSKLNPYQQSAGDIKRRVRAWHAART